MKVIIKKNIIHIEEGTTRDWHKSEIYFKKNFSNIASLIECKLHTGKTHQIRIVSQYLGCPIVGDTKYNKQNKYNFEKLKLNAHMLQFYMNDNKYEFTSKLPTDFLKFFYVYLYFF